MDRLGVIFLPLAGCGGGGGPASLLGAVRNRDVDPQGRSVDFSFSRKMRAPSAGDLAAFVSSRGEQAVSATLLAPADKVLRVVFDAFVLPGETTFDVSGLSASNGRPMRPASALPVSSTDAASPAFASSSASAFPNASNDRLSFAFDDDMVPSEAVDPGHYVFEHPIGSPVPLGPDAFAYDVASRTVTVLFDGADASPTNLQFGQGWRLLVSGVRDLAGNAMPRTNNIVIIP
ncbi:MAG: hypothetical protein ACREIU_06505 [Planctomycetota bacterium]